MTHVGAGHSGDITGVKISPDARYIVSVSEDGAIFRWKCPASLCKTTATDGGSAPVKGKQEVAEQEDGDTPKQESTTKLSTSKQEVMPKQENTPKQEVMPKQEEE